MIGTNLYSIGISLLIYRASRGWSININIIKPIFSFNWFGRPTYNYQYWFSIIIYRYCYKHYTRNIWKNITTETKEYT